MAFAPTVRIALVLVDEVSGVLLPTDGGVADDRAQIRPEVERREAPVAEVLVGVGVVGEDATVIVRTAAVRSRRTATAVGLPASKSDSPR